MSKTIDIRKKKMEEFFADDILDFSKFPFKEIKAHLSRFGVIDTTVIKNEENRKAYKDLLFSIAYTKQPYSYKTNSHSFNYVFKLMDFIDSLNNIYFLEIDSDELKAIFSKYCDENHKPKDMKKIIISCQNAVLDFRDTRVGLDRDYWTTSMMNLSHERVNLSVSLGSFNFRNIKNIESREYVKAYIRHLIGNTEMAFTTINNYVSILNQFCNFIFPNSVKETNQQQIKNYVQQKSNKSTDLINRFLNILSDFYKYLDVKGLYHNPNIITRDMFVKAEYKTIANTVDDYVINQIFKHLHKAPFNYMLMFLVSYCCGTRVSDICQLKTNCLYYDGDGGYYIEFSCQKMQKPMRNLIPEALYSLIQEQIKIINNLDYDEEYLFPSETKHNTPYNSQVFRNNFKKLCNEWGIKNIDGTPYNYTTHSFRHTIASDLYQNYGVPIATIQKAVLGHQELQMTLSYVERPDSFKKLQEDRYIEKTGEVKLAKWLKDNLRGRVLANGICGQPEILGACPNADACLTCEHFKTSRTFLPVLQNQLKTIKNRLPVYEADGCFPNIETAKEQINVLENLIQKIKEMEE